MTWGNISIAEWGNLEACIPVRMAYVIARKRGFIGCKASVSEISREIGADASLTLRLADDAIEAARTSRQRLRPDFYWTEPLMREKASAKLPFMRKLADHGLSPADVSFLKPDETMLRRFAESRLAGASQAEASRCAGWNKNHGLEDVLVNNLRARKFGGAFNEAANRKPARKWTRGATIGYSRMRKGGGGFLVNKAGDQLVSGKDKMGGGAALRVSRAMLELSCRVGRLFWSAIMAREALELSELNSEELDRVLKVIKLTDWSILKSERREYAVRMYWQVPVGTVIGESMRSTVSNGFITSSLDIPLDRV